MHIHQFPNEILRMIFHDLHDSLDFRRALRRKDVKPEVKWMQVQAVCRRWRDMMQDTPHYWRIINVYNKQHWLRLCLSRSAGQKTAASVYFRKYNIPPSLLQLLSLPSYTAYISLLSFNADDNHFDSLHHLFSRQFPNLSTLEWECPTDKMWMPSKPFVLPPQSVPRLENLLLFAVRPPEDFGVYANLHSLELSAFPWDVSWDTLLEVLNACAPTLENLGLVNILSEMTLRPDQHSGPSPITFPRLQTINVANKRPYLARILSHFRTPVATDVYLMDNLAGVRDHEIVALEQPLVGMLPPDPATIIPKLSTITEVQFTAWETEYTFIGRGPNDQGVQLELYRHEDDPPLAWSRMGRKGLMELLGLLSRADVRRFEIAVDYSTTDAGDFEAMFKAFPNLETLSLNGGGSFDYVLDLLAHDAPPSSIAPLSSSTDEGDGALKASETGAAQLWCSNLKTLVIGDVDDAWTRDDDLLDEILHFLRTRAGRGARLDRFEIRLTHNTEEDYQEASARYIPLFKELVGEVVYGTHRPEDNDCDACGSDTESEGPY